MGETNEREKSKKKEKAKTTSSKEKNKKKKKNSKTTRKRQNSKSSKKSKRNKQTCTNEVSDECLIAAVEVMDFERGQIGNFLKQVQRIKNQEKLMKNKNGKGGIFVEPAKHLMAALGGSKDSPKCGEFGTANK